MRKLFALVCALLPWLAWADTPISLYQSFAGNVNFVGTQATIRTAPNTINACSVLGPTTAVSATLTGIPSDATILAAHLYWAGSGSTMSTSVTMDGATVTAGSARRYTSATVGYNYFAAAADVTTAVASKRNGTYSLKGLTVDSSSSYCSVEGVLGGYALLVVYSQPNETYRVLNIYEGLQYVRYSSVGLSLSNFQIPSPLGAQTGRVSHITWEGDPTLSGGGESLFFNGYEMTDSLNPSGNQFNSVSNINGDSASYGIDFDAYSVTSPVIQAGQTSATTTYTSGQDLVLLNAEVIAVPNTPVSDLSVTMSLSSPSLTLGEETSYTINVSNVGPGTSNSATVTDTLPAQLTPLSAAGNGWNCSVSGQTVTCTSTTAIAAGASYPSITLYVQPTQYTGGTISNTATVTGANFDNVSGNNSATVSATEDFNPYVFTDKACTPNVPFGDPNQPCSVLSFDKLQAGMSKSAFITILGSSSASGGGGGGTGHGHGNGHGGNSCTNGHNPHCGGGGTGTDGVPFSPSSSSTTYVPMQFGLSCVNPISGTVSATFAGVSLPACAPNSDTPSGSQLSGSVTVSFGPGRASSNASYAFQYWDAGMVQLYLIDDSGSAGWSGIFVSRPYQLQLVSATRNSDGKANPASQSAPSSSDLAFVKAGEQFSMTVAAVGTDGSVVVVLPNYGNEITPDGIDVAPGIPNQDGLTNAGTLSGSFGTVSLGQASGYAFAWDEVGTLKLTFTDHLGDYLGTGALTGTSYVGRFVPDHFDTAVVTPMACAPTMTCPSTVAGAVYSGQPWTQVKVTAKNSSDAVTLNFSHGYAKDVTLAAYDAPGGSIANPGSGTLTNGTVTSSGNNFSLGVGSTASATYSLGTIFSNATPRATWTSPTNTYLRATLTEPSVGSDITITSKRSSGSVEGGAQVVVGRLRVTSTYGSELLMMPVPLLAQYYSGSAWLTSTTDSVSVVVASPIYNGCTKNLASSGSTCNAALLVSLSTADMTLASGAATFRIKAPGAGNNGSANLTFGTPSYLPSAQGTLVFGTYRSPVIYTRESY